MKNTMPGSTPVVDFDYFHFDGHGFNYEIAKSLSVLLIQETNVDELKSIYNENEKWDSSVGTGGTGSNYNCPSQSSQRACLASHFASYALRKYQSCYLSLYEYYCLKDLLTYMDEDCFPSQHREKIHDANVKLLTDVVSEFEKAYVKENPSFLFTLLKK